MLLAVVSIDMVNLGKKLRALRTAKGMTQEQLAKRLGLTKSVISAYENAARYPSYDILVRIAAIFGVTTDYLLGVEHREVIDVSGLTRQNVALLTALANELKEKA